MQNEQSPYSIQRNTFFDQYAKWTSPYNIINSEIMHWTGRSSLTLGSCARCDAFHACFSLVRAVDVLDVFDARQQQQQQQHNLRYQSKKRKQRYDIPWVHTKKKKKAKYIDCARNQDVVIIGAPYDTGSCSIYHPYIIGNRNKELFGPLSSLLRTEPISSLVAFYCTCHRQKGWRLYK